MPDSSRSRFEARPLSPASQRPPLGDSFIVSKFGLDGVRQHYMPGNRRTGAGMREKRPFDTEDDATDFIVALNERETGQRGLLLFDLREVAYGSQKRA